MCSPLAAVGATTALSLANESEKAKYGKAAFKQAKARAEDNALRAYGAIQERQQQETAAAAQAIAKNAEQARLAIGSAATSTAEAGVAGNAAAALIQDYEQTSLEYERTVIRNKAFLDAQFARDAHGIRQNEEAEILRALPEPPNYLGVLVGGATQALSIYGAQKNQQPDQP
jgi:predicted amidohydrolase YtcJ